MRHNFSQACQPALIYDALAGLRALVLCNNPFFEAYNTSMLLFILGRACLKQLAGIAISDLVFRD